MPVLASDGQGGTMPASAPFPPATVSRAGTLRRRDVRLLLAGQATSELGSQVGSIALPLVAVVALVVGAARVLFDVAYPSYLPALVGRDDLVRANAYLEPSRSATQLAGPGLGGWLVQLAGAAPAVAADAVSFLASAGCLLAIRAAEPRPARPGRRDLRRELAEGLRFVLAQPALLAALAAARVARAPTPPA